MYNCLEIWIGGIIFAKMNDIYKKRNLRDGKEDNTSNRK